MFERLAYIPTFIDTYESELSWVEYHAQQGAEYVEKQRASLTRSDGSRVYGDAEHAEREQAIVEKARATFDANIARYAAKAEADAADIQKQVVLLDRDPFDGLKPEEQQRASLRREFVKEDALTLPAHELAKQVQAALAGTDKAQLYLLHRYVAQRMEARRGQPATEGDHALMALSRDLGERIGIGDRGAQRRDLEAKLRAAQAFPVAVETARNTFDGSLARAVEQQRAYMMARF
jgi:hypothetical protein